VDYQDMTAIGIGEGSVFEVTISCGRANVIRARHHEFANLAELLLKWYCRRIGFLPFCAKEGLRQCIQVFLRAQVRQAIKGGRLGRCTGYSVHREGSGSRIAAIPGTIEARAGIDRRACRNLTIIRGIRDGHARPALGDVAIPELRDLLAAREGKIQGPTVPCG
jgi:hypothetical protein